jgi:DNA-binding transcriptional regulator LsrR (DeoR family)
VYKGRKPTIDADEVWWLCHDEKLGLAAIARRLGIGRPSVYRVLGTPVTDVTNGDGNADQD